MKEKEVLVLIGSNASKYCSKDVRYTELSSKL
jgi:hypothetical protein